MLTTTKTINQRTSELFGLIDHFGADVDLHDLVSGECIRPDARQCSRVASWPCHGYRLG